jgi:hypothetical protein
MIYKFWNFENFLKILWKFWNFFLIFFHLMKYVNFEILWKFCNFWKFLKYWNWNFFEKFSILIFFFKFYKIYILNPLPTHGILTPLPMVYRPPYLWYIKPSLMVLWTPLLVEMRGGVQFTMRGFKIQWQKIDPGVKIP